MRFKRRGNIHQVLLQEEVFLYAPGVELHRMQSIQLVKNVVHGEKFAGNVEEKVTLQKCVNTSL